MEQERRLNQGAREEGGNRRGQGNERGRRGDRGGRRGGGGQGPIVGHPQPPNPPGQPPAPGGPQPPLPPAAPVGNPPVAGGAGGVVANAGVTVRASMFWQSRDNSRMCVLTRPSLNPPDLFSDYKPVVDLFRIRRSDLKKIAYFDQEGRSLPSYYSDKLNPILRPTYNLHHKLTSEQLAAMQETVSSVTLLNGTNPSPHGFLAATREWFEESIYMQLRQKYPDQGGVVRRVVDVGAGIVRHHNAGRAVHAMMPSVLPSDEHRWAQWLQIQAAGGVGDLRTCRHRIQDCTCALRGCPGISIHSLYYLTPFDIMVFMEWFEMPELVALHHKFDVAGSFGNEAVYATKPGKWDTIEMHVVGNSTPYVHDRIDWLEEGRFCQGRVVLTWDTVAVGPPSLNLWRTNFKVAVLAVAPAKVISPSTFVQSLTDLLQHRREGTAVVGRKDVQFNSLLATLFRTPSRWEWLATKLNPFRTPDYGEFEVVFNMNTWTFVLGRGRQRVMVSRSCAHEISTRLSGRVVGNAEYDAALAMARQFFVHKVNVPIIIGEELLLPTVRLGIAMALRKNEEHFQALAGVSQRLFDANVAARDWMVPVKKQWPGYLAIFLASVGTMAMTRLLWWFGGRHVVQFLIRWTMRPSYGAIMGGAPRKRTVIVGALALAALLLLSRKRAKGSSGGRVYTPRPGVCSGDDVPLPPIGVDEKGDPVHSINVTIGSPCQIQFGNVCVMGTAYREPQVMGDCVHNVNVALRKRLMAKDHTPIQGYTVDPQDKEIQVLVKHEPLKPTPIVAWLARFPPTRRAVLLEAYNQLLKCGPKPEQYHKRKLFVKRENYNKRFFIGFWVQVLLKARGISDPDREYLVRTGPITHAVSEALKRGWNGKRVNVLYASGYTPDQLGQFYAGLVERWGPDVKFVEADAANFDGSVRKEHYVYELGVYALMGVEKVYLDLIAIQAGRKKVQWIDRTSPDLNMVVAMLTAVRNSGDGNTSCGNSILTTKNTRIMVEGIFDLGFLFVLGDDSLFITPGWVTTPNVKDMVARANEAGYSMEIKTGVGNKGTFCSGVFVPCTLGGQQTFVWASLPGRVLSKIGYCTHNYEHHPDPDTSYERWMQGVLMGIERDYAFVPVIRVFIARGLALLKHEGVKPITHRHRLHMKKWAEANDETMTWFNDRYDTNCLEVWDCERMLREWDGRTKLEHPLIEKMCNVDVPMEAEPVVTPYFSWWDSVQPTIFRIKPVIRRIWHWAPAFATMYAATLGEGIRELRETKAPLSLWWKSAFHCFGLKPTSHTTLGTAVLDILMLTPLVEETIKEALHPVFGSYTGFVFGVGEFWLNFKAMNYQWPAPLMLAIPLILHTFVFTHPKPWWQRVALHSSWNGWAMGWAQMSKSGAINFLENLEKVYGSDLNIEDWATHVEEIRRGWTQEQREAADRFLTGRSG